MSENGNNGREPALMNELNRYCSSASLSEEGLSEIIERHGLTPNNDNALINNYYFFLRACCNERVNEGVIRCLLEYFPDAASHTDGDGTTPLHYACNNKNMTRGIIEVLIDAAPTSVRNVDYRRQMPLHLLCFGSMEETAASIRCLVEYFPAAASATDIAGQTPLHVACRNPNPSMTLGVIQLLIDAAPDSLRSVNSQGEMPLHVLCATKSINETEAVEIMKLLIERNPDAVRHGRHCLPIHIAARSKSPEFCRLLIEAYPESVQMTGARGYLPLHWACKFNTFATVEYLCTLYPDAINHADTDGFYPIHDVIYYMSEGVNTESAIEIVRYLLDCDPNVTLQKIQGKSLLHFACQWNYDDSNIETGIEVIKAIYDAHPEAIEGERIVQNFQRWHRQVQAFINSEMVYARQAKDLRLMMTPDGNGQLPLHRALEDNVRLGSIKLLVKGDPTAILSRDNSGALPLHIASQQHNSANVIQYFVRLDTSTLAAADNDGNTALHYACRSARHEIIALLLGKHVAVSVSRRNAHGKLPIDLLWESNSVEDRESVEYTDSVFRLLKAYPETVPNADT